MGKNFLSNLFSNSVLQEPGDEISARVTNSGRQVLKFLKTKAALNIAQHDTKTELL